MVSRIHGWDRLIAALKDNDDCDHDLPPDDDSDYEISHSITGNQGPGHKGSLKPFRGGRRGGTEEARKSRKIERSLGFSISFNFSEYLSVSLNFFKIL